MNIFKYYVKMYFHASNAVNTLIWFWLDHWLSIFVCNIFSVNFCESLIFLNKSFIFRLSEASRAMYVC